jgi:peroxiredoxin
MLTGRSLPVLSALRFALLFAAAAALASCGGGGGAGAGGSSRSPEFAGDPAVDEAHAAPAAHRKGGEVTAALGPPAEGDAAPEFALSDDYGQFVRLSELKGSPVVLAFGSSQDAFSAKELEALYAMSQGLMARGVKFVIVDVRDTVEGYKEYAARKPIAFPMVRDVDGTVAQKFAPLHAEPAMKDRAAVAVGAVLVLDKDGKVVFFMLPDSDAFDPGLAEVRKRLEAMK